METAQEWGRRVEELAKDWFLERRAGRGAKLLERNWRCKQGEIDLIFEESDRDDGFAELVFVEVRARSRGGWTRGLESVSCEKRLRLGRAISLWLARYRGDASSVRCDVMDWDGISWNHVVDAWRMKS